MAEWLLDLLSHIAIDSSRSYRWFGRGFVVQPGLSVAWRDDLVASVTGRLYSDFFCPGVPAPPDNRSLPTPLPSGRFQSSLSADIQNHRTLERGFRVDAVSRDQLRVSRDGIEFRCQQRDVAEATSGVVRPGDVVSVWAPAVRSGLAPGFLCIFGTAAPGRDEALSRYYFNAAPEGAADLVHAIYLALSECDVEFSLKALLAPEDYLSRSDCIIVYTAKRDRDRALPSLTGVAARLAEWLDPRVPAMTFEVAPGFATADDPGGGESFGESRCRVLAECIVDSWARVDFRRPSNNEVRRLAGNRGLDLAPHTGLPNPIATPGWWARSPVSSIDASVEILDRVCRAAVWSGTRCNWIAPNVELSGRLAPTLTYASLGQTLYEGTSGIALVLSLGWLTTGIDDFRRTARGAAMQVVAGLSGLSSGSGLFDGLIGVALTLGYAARILQEEEIFAAAQSAAKMATTSPINGMDLMSGAAGAVLAFHSCAQVFGDPSFDAHASLLARHLAAGVRTHYGDATLKRSVDALTGLSHGASGIAVALAESQSRYPGPALDLALESVLAFERCRFDPDIGNWPDFRHHHARGNRFGSAWCHGAPGIALARLRLRELDGAKDAVADETRIALDTTAALTQQMLRAQRYNFSLCHGLAGNAEILREGKAINQVYADLADEVSTEVRRRYVGRSVAWPCPMQGGEHPGLMTGLAGMALFYLRSHDDRVPSMLLIRPSNWAGLPGTVR